jgi:hypothetical protein
MPNLLNLLIGVIVLALIVYIAFWVLGQIPMAQPVRAVITGVIAIILLLILIQYLGYVNIFGF